jgi:hypothetical protein
MRRGQKGPLTCASRSRFERELVPPSTPSVITGRPQVAHPGSPGVDRRPRDRARPRASGARGGGRSVRSGATGGRGLRRSAAAPGRPRGRRQLIHGRARGDQHGDRLRRRRSRPRRCLERLRHPGRDGDAARAAIGTNVGIDRASSRRPLAAAGPRCRPTSGHGLARHRSWPPRNRASGPPDIAFRSFGCSPDESRRRARPRSQRRVAPLRIFPRPHPA